MVVPGRLRRRSNFNLLTRRWFVFLSLDGVVALPSHCLLLRHAISLSLMASTACFAIARLPITGAATAAATAAPASAPATDQQMRGRFITSLMVNSPSLSPTTSTFLILCPSTPGCVLLWGVPSQRLSILPSLSLPLSCFLCSRV